MTRYPRGVLVSCEVPWSEADEFLEPIFRDQVRLFLNHGFQHIYIFGTAGEGYAVSNARFRQIATVFHQETRGEGVLPQVGVIALSTLTVRERIDIAYELGFRTFQISLPAWGALSDKELLRFFRDVCLPYPDSRFLHYNLLRTRRLLTAADYRTLTQEIPNLVATKNTSPDISHVTALVRTAPELQHFLGESTFVNGCATGECSLLSSFAPVFPQESLALYDAAVSGDFATALQKQNAYMAAVMNVIGPLIRQPYIDGAYDKALVRLGGIDMPLRLLSPYECLPQEVFDEAQQILRTQYPNGI